MGKAKSQLPSKVAVVLPYYAQQANEVARGATRFARASGRFLLCDVPFVDHRKIPTWIARLRPAGAIVWLAANDWQEIRSDLPPGLAMVSIGASGRFSPEIGTVRSCDEAMVDLLHQHLSTAGYQRFAYVGASDVAVSQRRLELFRQRVGRGGDVQYFDLSFVPFDETTEPASHPRVERWLRKLQPPVGVVTWNGHYAECVGMACREVGLKVPQDIGILSISDDRACVFADPPVSAVRVDGEALGYAAMKILATLLRGRRAPAEPVEIPPRKVIARGSAEPERRGIGHIDRALAYIDQHAFEGINVDDVLRTTQTISRRKFYQDFAAQVGCSPADYIRRMKIARARKLLVSTTLSIKRVASMCGFQSVPQFYDAFSRHLGTTPRKYREKR